MTPAARANPAAAAQLVALLRAELGSASPPRADAVAASDWPTLEQTAEMHGLAPFLASLLTPFAECVREDLRERFELRAIGNRLRNTIVGGLLRELDARLAAADAPAVPLKGAALLYSLYGEAGPRPLSDIDVLVPRDRLETARRALGALGFSAVIEPDEHFFRRSMHTVFHHPELSSIAVEVHWDLAEAYRPYAFDLDAIWAATRPLGSGWGALRAMAREHTLAHLCLHLERHAIFYRHILDRDDWFDMVVGGGAGSRLIWLYDIAFCVQRWAAMLDWDRFVHCCERWAIAPHARTVLEICRRVFLVEPPGHVIDRLPIGRVSAVESIASRALMAPSREGSPGMAGPSHRYRNATLALNAWGFLIPSAAYLRRRYGAGTRLPVLRLYHLVAAGAATVSALMSILRRARRRWRSPPSTARRRQSDGAAAARLDRGEGYPRAPAYLMAERVRTWLAVYDPVHNSTHRLNPPAARVLALCDGSRTAGAIAAELRRQANGGPELDDADVGAAIDLLQRTGLLSATAEPRPGPVPDAPAAS